MILGIDFDNTIISYDAIFYQEALKRKYIKPGLAKNKRDIRDAIRKIKDGEAKWQQLQVYVYGKAILGARLIDGVKKVVREAKKRNIKVYVVSHKTEFERLGSEPVNLRTAALAWMKKNKFFDKSGFGLKRNQVFFESTRQKKIERIKTLGCTHFIDDLEETFLESTFPKAVEQILFTSQATHDLKNVTMCRSWEEIYAALFDPSSKLRAVVSRLLKKEACKIERLAGGLNSQVYQLDLTDRSQLAAKFYDPKRRNRLTQEYNGLSFLYQNGIVDIPQPILLSEDNSVAIYAFIKGKRFTQVTKKDISIAVRFLSGLKNLSKQLPPASEACFSIEDVNENLKARLARFTNVKDAALQKFLKDFATFYRELSDWLRAKASEYGIDLYQKISEHEKTLSPSDFGFHNALRTKGGIVFLDFEHFGVDDPAKMMSDVLLHPAMKLTNAQKKQFVREVLAAFSDNRKLRKRLELVYPLFGLKWCLIFLNEFIKQDFERRAFASRAELNQKTVLRVQLNKAKRMLNRMKKEYRKFPHV